MQKYKEALEASYEQRIKVAEQSESSQENEYWHELEYLKHQKGQLWLHLTPALYYIFWGLSVTDIVVPSRHIYDRELNDVYQKFNKKETKLFDSTKQKISKELND